jgi:hypothetical protein
MWGTERSMAAAPKPLASAAHTAVATVGSLNLGARAAYAPSAHLRGERGVKARALMHAEEAARPPAAAPAAEDVEKLEVAELHQLFGSARGSPVPATLVAKCQVQADKLHVADQCRRDKAARDEARAANERALADEAQERRARVRSRDERVKREMTNRTLKQGQRACRDLATHTHIIIMISSPHTHMHNRNDHLAPHTHVIIITRSTSTHRHAS